MGMFGGEPPTACPECLESGTDEEIHVHLMRDHGWTEQRVKAWFGDSKVTKVSGPGAPPISDDQTTPDYDNSVEDNDHPEIEKAKDESDLCDCDPKYKESQVIPKSSGLNLGPVGGNSGDGVPVIICSNCGRHFETKGDDDSFGPGFFSEDRGPGPF